MSATRQSKRNNMRSAIYVTRALMASTKAFRPAQTPKPTDKIQEPYLSAQRVIK